MTKIKRKPVRFARTLEIPADDFRAAISMY